MFQQSFEVRWADLDPNQHVRHTVYGDWAAQVRVDYLRQNDFPPQKFLAIHCGPILFEEKLRYLKEVRLGDHVTVDAQLQGLSAAGERWKIMHQVYRNQKDVAVIIEVSGAWLDLQKRRLTTPPPEVLKIMQQLPTTEDYQEIVMRS